MKKILILIFALLILFSFSACKSKEEKVLENLGNLINAALNGDLDSADALDSYGENNMSPADSFKLKGLEKSAIEPNWAYDLKDESSDIMVFNKKDGEVSIEEYNTWLKKIFDTTAKTSDDGYNIEGFMWGNGEVQKTWDDFNNSESFLKTWSYKYKGIIYDVYTEHISNPDVDDEFFYDEDANEWKWIYHKIGVSVNISEGLQKSWAEYEKELEDALGELDKIFN
ncbi:MAG: hypothetical protein FWF92_04500 [Oscillospiraceae bacterium]|nr:hypothetical protein [Oscillospiraceae bacterium]